MYDSLKVSCPPESFDDYWFHYRLWHSRYAELSEADFEEFYQKPLYQYFRGFGINFDTQKLEIPTAVTTPPIHAMPLSFKSEEYYRKIIELCASKNIPLLIVVSPFAVIDKEQMQFIQSGLIADEYDVDFINFNSLDGYEAMELDFNTDFGDAQHLNYIGNVKYTRLLAEIISERYDIPDRRGNPRYTDWELHSRDILCRTLNQYLKAESDLDGYIHKLQDKQCDYTIAVMAAGCTMGIAQYAEGLSAFGIDMEELQDGSLYIIKDGATAFRADQICWNYKDTLDNNILESRKETKFIENSFVIDHSLVWNHYDYAAADKGIYFLVYDNFTKELADVCRFYVDTSSGMIIKEQQ